MKIEFVPEFRPEIKLTVEDGSEDYALRNIAEQFTKPGVRLGWLHHQSTGNTPGFISFYPEAIPDDVPKGIPQ